MSMLRTPRCASASITALTYAAGEPTVADSPTPLAPIGWCGDGVHRLEQLERRRLPRGRDQVVHEVGADAVAVLVEGDPLHRRHREALGEAAVDLALDDHRVDPHAAVVDARPSRRTFHTPVPRSTSTTTT